MRNKLSIKMIVCRPCKGNGVTVPPDSPEDSYEGEEVCGCCHGDGIVPYNRNYLIVDLLAPTFPVTVKGYIDFTNGPSQDIEVTVHVEDPTDFDQIWAAMDKDHVNFQIYPNLQGYGIRTTYWEDGTVIFQADEEMLKAQAAASAYFGGFVGL